MNNVTKNAYIALFNVCSDVYEPFGEYKKDSPKIGDKVNPSHYFSEGFTYRIDVHPDTDSTLTMDEIKNATWKCVKIHSSSYHITETFSSVEKIRGRIRRISFKDRYGLTCEIVNMPERSRLIIEYKNGQHTLVELLKIFRDKNYLSTLTMKAINHSISGNTYLEIMEAIGKA